MEEVHRTTLRRNWVFLSENLVTSELLDHMLADCVFTQDMYEEIKAEITRKDQVTKFLFILQRRGPQAFDKFLTGLHNTHQEFIAQRLAQTLYEISGNNQNHVLPQPMQT